jgi:hypothetical protein
MKTQYFVSYDLTLKAQNEIIETLDAASKQEIEELNTCKVLQWFDELIKRVDPDCQIIADHYYRLQRLAFRLYRDIQQNYEIEEV